MSLPPVRVISHRGQTNIKRRMINHAISTIDGLHISIRMVIPGCYDVTVNDIAKRLIVNENEQILITEYGGIINIKSEPLSEEKPTKPETIGINNISSSSRGPSSSSMQHQTPSRSTSRNSFQSTSRNTSRNGSSIGVSFLNVADAAAEFIEGMFDILNQID